jgi:hypothetical protein
MADSGGIPAAEAGGIIGGTMNFLTLIGGAIAWTFRRSDTRRATREAKLEGWHQELEAREKRLDEGRTLYITRLEERLAIVEAKPSNMPSSPPPQNQTTWCPVLHGNGAPSRTKAMNMNRCFYYASVALRRI